MPKVRRLLRKEITYSEARKEETNILHRLQFPDQQHEFFARVSENRYWIKEIVAHHLRLSLVDLCEVADVKG